jgi:hypothetical protein
MRPEAVRPVMCVSSWAERSSMGMSLPARNDQSRVLAGRAT